MAPIANTSNCVSAPSGMAAWWDGDQISGSSVTDRNGSNTGAATSLTASAGKVGNAFSLNGSSSQIAVAHASGVSPSSTLSIAAWVNGGTASRVSKQQTILSKWGFNGSAFTDTTNASGAWQGYVLPNSDYTGGAFDGRYVYYFPGSSAVVQRYDTQGSFTSAGSWQTVTLTAVIGAGYQNYLGGVFDGRYIYLAPNGNTNGNMARFDTLNGNFTSTGWEGVDMDAVAGMGTTNNGYFGALFDGRYVYYLPDSNGAPHGNVARFDTTGSFTAAASWSTVNLAAILGANYTQYLGGAFDGRYIYLAPFATGSGFAARYDTQSGNFTSAAGWQGVDLDGVAGMGANYNGFLGAGFDGRYVYFSPYANGGGQHGYVARFDTQNGDFTSSGWEGVNVGTAGLLSNNNTGFAGVFHDGRYVYFTPRLAASGNNGHITRYDTTGSFSSAGSWASVNMASITGLGAGYVAYRGGVYDGRYLYLPPRSHANAARFDTLGSNASYQLAWSQADHNGFGNSLPGITFSVNTTAGYLLSARAQATASAATWTHVTGTYDGSTARLYVNGSLAASQSGSSSIVNNSSQVAIGNLTTGNGYFGGLLDELMLFSGALSATSISSIYSAGANGLCK